MPSFVEKPTATRSNNLQWSGISIKTPLDSDVPEENLRFSLALMAAILRATMYQSVRLHFNLTYYTLIIHLIIH